VLTSIFRDHSSSVGLQLYFSRFFLKRLGVLDRELRGGSCDPTVLVTDIGLYLLELGSFGDGLHLVGNRGARLGELVG
jgi:hypothetical protein